MKKEPKTIYQVENIWRIANSMVKRVFDANLREDLRQEFAIGALTGMRKVDRSASQGANRFIWLHGYYQMVRYWNLRNKWDAEAECSLQDIVHEDLENPEERYNKIAAIVDDPHDVLEGVELSDLSKELLRHTSRQRRWILYYRYLRREPMKIRQIAKRLKCSNQNVSQLEHKGLNDIRKWMKWNLLQFSKAYKEDFGDDIYLRPGERWERVDGMWERVDAGV